MDNNSGSGTRLPESPRVPMEFLSRSWSASAVEVSKALSPHISMLFKAAAATTTTTTATKTAVVPERSISGGESDDQYRHKKNYPSTAVVAAAAAVSTNNNNNSNNPLFPYAASSAASQRVLDRILSQSQSSSQMMLMMQQQDGSVGVSPLTSGRPSLSSEPNYLNNNNNNNNASTGGGGGDSCGSSPPISPSSQDFYDVVKFLRSSNTPQPQFNGGRSNTTTANGGGGKTVGRWLKDRREKKKEETRAHNAQLHAAVSVAGVAAAIAAIAAATAASSGPGLGEKTAKTDTVVASAATLVAAQCVEAAEALGAERDHLASVISSAVNVRSCDDIVTLTAGAATALRGAATLKARALKDVWNVAAETPVQKAVLGTTTPPSHSFCNNNYSGDLDGYSQEFLARGCELLKRTRKGDLHWKIVSVYLHRSGQVMLKMKSRHVGGTITKKKKNVVQEVYKDMPAWPGRHFLEGREHRYYFGLRTELRGIVEFECKNQKEHDLWTQGVLNLLAIVAEKKYRRQT